MSNEQITDHHDGHGLNERIEVENDGTLYRYYVYGDVTGTDRAIEAGCTGKTREKFANITFQSQNPADGVNGITDEALIAIMLDRARAWQQDPNLATRENAIVITKLEEALHWKRHRADNRAKRGVLGTRQK